MLDLVLRNGRIAVGSMIIEGDLGIAEGKIERIAKKLSGEKNIDVRGCLILPGLIDSHVHFREPGLSQKEDWFTGSSAAAAGGVTTVLDMPNNLPPTTTKQLLDEKRMIAASRSVVDYGFHFGATLKNTEEIRKAKNIASVKYYMGSSTGDLLIDDDPTVLEQFRALSKKRIPATVHAEDESIIKKETGRLKSSGRMDAEAYSESRPAEAAVSAAKKAVKLAASGRTRLHVCHISTKAEVALMKKRKDGSLTCEATPHHLFLTRGDYGRLGVLGKMNPPLRAKEDAAALWKGLREGTIDAIASDHAPHLLKEKEGSIWDAPAGVPGVETMLPLLLNEVNKKRLSISLLTKLTSGNPAKIFRIKNKGRIRKGYDADLVVVDMKKEAKIEDYRLRTKCGWSPFEGMTLKGWPVKTFVRGNPVFDSGNININKGREVSYVIP